MAANLPTRDNHSPPDFNPESNNEYISQPVELDENQEDIPQDNENFAIDDSENKFPDFGGDHDMNKMYQEPMDYPQSEEIQQEPAELDEGIERYTGIFSDANADFDVEDWEEDGNEQDDQDDSYDGTDKDVDNSSGGFSDKNELPQNIGGQFDYDADDLNWDKDDEVADSRIDILKLEVMDKEEAREIAEVIIEMLEDNIAKYLEEQGIVPNSENYDEYGRLKDVKDSKRKVVSVGSSISIDSNVSLDYDEGQPSTMRLFYAQEESDLREFSIPNIPEGDGVDEIVQVTLHRNKKLFGKKKISTKEAETQTKVTALVTKDVGERIFWKLYPKPDDWKAPGVPSRHNSMVLAVDKADVDKNEDVDKPTIKPQIKRSIKKRILKPLPDDYFREQTFWTGSRFKGEYRNRQFHLGHFDFATGTTYDSEFKNGHAHSRNHTGMLVYPRGDTYEGQWRKGRFQAGKITFADGLEYEPRNWNYCSPPDRRFKSEKIIGIHAAGNTIYNDRFPPSEIQKLPVGCYDVGEGIYDPNTSSITAYDGSFLRDVTKYEHDWIVENCRKQMYPWERYTAKFNEDRLPGSSCEKRPCNKY